MASVQINASREDVWAVLTDYEKLPEVVPGLVGCERLPPVAGAPKRLVRLRQVGFKNMMYMHLHAETTLALVESPCTEIQFKQINGDFQMLQGKFMLGSEPVPGVRFVVPKLGLAATTSRTHALFLQTTSAIPSYCLPVLRTIIACLCR